MLSNYLKIALRNFSRYKIYSFINIFGLAIGITCCVLILLFVQNELTFDRFHGNADRIFRILDMRSSPDRGERIGAYASGPMREAFVRDFPEVVDAVQFFNGWRITMRKDENRIIARKYYFTDGSFFSVFDFNLLQGDAATALNEPNAVVLTETTARQLFGDEDPLGKLIRIDAEDFPEFGESDFRVTGVLQDIPSNSHLDFKLLVSSATLNRFDHVIEWFTGWNSTFLITYGLLKEGANLAGLEAKLPAFSAKYRGEEARENRKISLQPLADVHFFSDHIQFEENRDEGNLTYVYILALIASFIVLIACINYMNLATARSMKRAKEVGLRKVVGALKRQLTGQFLSESILAALVSMLVAMVLVEISLPWFNEIAGKDLVFRFADNQMIFAGMLIISLLIGIISGSYPALFLSKFQPVAAMKGVLSGSRGAARLRRILVVTQFALSIIMIIATLIVFQQLAFMRNKQLGFNKEQLAVIDINHYDVQTNFLTIKSELLRHPGVSSVAVSSRVPGDWKNFRRITVQTEAAAEDEGQRMYFNGIDEAFLTTYEIELLQGRNFDRKFASDSTGLLLNETAAKMLFTGSPIGETIRVPGQEFEGQVIGVVKDFHFHSLHSEIKPMIMGFMPAGGRHVIHGIDYFTLRINAAGMQDALNHIAAVHAKFDRINPMELDFLTGWLDQQYENDARVGNVFGISAALAIMIACVGLFGLSAFMAEQRTKEIGVRKILGASVGSIILLLSKDFSQLVLIAMIVAAPAAYIAMDIWLADFAYRINMEWWVFAFAGATAFIITFITISYQAVKAAFSNPVNALRYE